MELRATGEAASCADTEEHRTRPVTWSLSWTILTALISSKKRHWPYRPRRPLATPYGMCLTCKAKAYRGIQKSSRRYLIYLLVLRWPWQPLWSSGQSSWLQNGDVLCFLRGTNWIYIC
jgi:hypothetical protein